jgi:hypothetical protein
MKKIRIQPEWKISDFHNLDYFLTTHKDKILLDQYVNFGHNRDSMTLYNCHEPSYMPNCVHDYIKPQFDFLEHIAFAINLFKPGQYLPIHTDIFGKYMKLYDVKFENIVRYIIMLEDSLPGQILQIESKCIGEWNSGDCFGWKYNQRHAFYNFSMKDRYAIQVTGTLK